MIADALKVGVLMQHGVVGVQEKVKGVLVQEVHLEQEKTKRIVCFVYQIPKYRTDTQGISTKRPDLVESLHGEVDAAAGRGQRQVLL